MRILKRVFQVASGVTLLLSGLSVGHSGMVLADTVGSVTTYNVPTSASHPYGIIEGPDGNMWFTEEGSGKIGRYVTRTSTFTEYTPALQTENPSHIAVDLRGTLWTSGVHLVNYKTDGTLLGVYTVPTSLHVGQSTGSIVGGSDGNIWFATINTSTDKDYIVSVDTSGTNYTAHEISRWGQVQGMVTDYRDGSLWFSQMPSSGQPTIGHIYPDGTQDLYTIPSPATLGVQKITLAPDGKLWFTDANYAGYLDTTDNDSFTMFSFPSGSGANGITVGPDGNVWVTLGNVGKVAQVTPSGTVTNYSLPSSSSRPIGITTASDGNLWIAEYGSNQIAKMGTGFTASSIDNDQDGLNQTDEMAQGTSDYNPDTDGDGLSDYVESTSYPNRDAVFCDAATNYCEYPDPLSKDLYVEVDWMVKPDPGGYSMKPDSTVIDSLVDAYAAHGITAHFDTGQLGGGNEVPYNAPLNYFAQAGVVDIFDYRDGGDGIPQEFSALRKGIWHYAVSGYNWYDGANSGSLTSSGATGAGSNLTFVSYGLIKDNQSGFGYSSLDTAIAGTFIHELGHQLCLAPAHVYDEQSAACVYPGIDSTSFTYINYVSSMYYPFQMQIVDYSDGSHTVGTGDHNDWSAIALPDFTHHSDYLINPPDEGLTIAQAKAGNTMLKQHGVAITHAGSRTTITHTINGKKTVLYNKARS